MTKQQSKDILEAILAHHNIKNPTTVIEISMLLKKMEQRDYITALNAFEKMHDTEKSAFSIHEALEQFKSAYSRLNSDSELISRQKEETEKLKYSAYKNLAPTVFHFSKKGPQTASGKAFAIFGCVYPSLKKEDDLSYFKAVSMSFPKVKNELINYIADKEFIELIEAQKVIAQFLNKTEQKNNGKS